MSEEGKLIRSSPSRCINASLVRGYIKAGKALVIRRTIRNESLEYTGLGEFRLMKAMSL